MEVLKDRKLLSPRGKWGIPRENQTKFDNQAGQVDGVLDGLGVASVNEKSKELLKLIGRRGRKRHRGRLGGKAFGGSTKVRRQEDNCLRH